jgi:hypothetical protein
MPVIRETVTACMIQASAKWRSASQRVASPAAI